MKAVPTAGLQELAHRVVEKCDDLTAIAGYLLLDALDHLPPVRRRNQQQRDMVRLAFVAGRNYERQRLGLPPPTSSTDAASATEETRLSGRRHLSLV